MSGSRGSLRAKLLLALFASAITLALLEAGARLYISRLADREQFSKYASLAQYRERIGGDEWWMGLLTPHRYLGYAGAADLVDGENRHNSLGFRGEEVVVPKPAGEFRIACLGASTTYSIFVADHEKSYPALLQSELHRRGFRFVSVANAGIPAWTSYETLINYLIRIQDLEPDLIIIHQAFGDVASRLVWPPEAYRDDNSGYLSARFAMREAPFYESSALLRILMVESGRSPPASAFGKSVYNEADTSHYLEFARQRMTRRYPRGIFERVPVATMLAANPPRYFRRNTRSLVVSAKHADVQPVLMTFAYTPEVEGFFGVEGFRQATDEHNRILAEIAREQGVPFFDLRAVFPTEKSYWGYDGIHVNERGTALKAELVADFLVDHDLIVRPADLHETDP
jgi:lysophospholipase L1-like esterase